VLIEFDRGTPPERDGRGRSRAYVFHSGRSSWRTDSPIVSRMQEADETGSPVTWGEHVSDEQYAAAPPIAAGVVSTAG
jgi:hypothetical protein